MHMPTKPATEITVQIKNVYGAWKVYPANAAAHAFAQIAGTKTLTYTTLCAVLFLGIQITEIDRNGRPVATYTQPSQLPAQD